MTYMPDDVDQRRHALALHKAYREAEDDYLQSDEDVRSLPPEAVARIEAIKAEYKQETPLRAAYEQAEAAYENADGDALLEDDEGAAKLCAATGLPIWETDEVVEDPETGEVFLRGAIGLPPRQVEDDEFAEAAE